MIDCAIPDSTFPEIDRPLELGFSAENCPQFVQYVWKFWPVLLLKSACSQLPCAAQQNKFTSTSWLENMEQARLCRKIVIRCLQTQHRFCFKQGAIRGCAHLPETLNELASSATERRSVLLEILQTNSAVVERLRRCTAAHLRR